MPPYPPFTCPLTCANPSCSATEYICVCVACLSVAATLSQMGLHVFFGCYFNLFRLMAKCGVLENLLLKEHTHTFCNNDGDVRELDFRFFLNGTKIGAPFHGGWHA